MLSRLGFWLLGESSQGGTPREGRSLLAIFLIVAFCYNALPPNFFFDGNSTTGESGSVIKQVFWIGVFLLAVSTASVNARLRASLFFYTLPLIALCFFILMSAVWSLDPVITLRRSILQCILILSVLLLINSMPRVEQVFLIIYRISSVVLVFNLFMLLRPNGFDDAGLFRGIHPHKNVAGYISATSIIVAVWVRRSGNFSSLWWNNFYIFAWCALLLLAVSKTSIALTLGAPLVALVFWWVSRWLNIGLWVPVVTLTSISYSAFAVAFISGFDVSQSLVDWIEKIGFTGRDDIWSFMVVRFLENAWLGHGYGGFWDIGPNSPNILYGTGYVPMINQAHNGYLDVLLNLGVVGAVMYLVILSSFFVSLPSNKTVHDSVYLLCWCLLVFSLLHNLTESSILRGYSWVWVVQLIVLAVSYRLATEGSKAV